MQGLEVYQDSKSMTRVGLSPKRATATTLEMTGGQIDGCGERGLMLYKNDHRLCRSGLGRSRTLGPGNRRKANPHTPNKYLFTKCQLQTRGAGDFFSCTGRQGELQQLQRPDFSIPLTWRHVEQNFPSSTFAFAPSLL